MNKYKNVSDSEQTVEGIGAVKAGEVVTINTPGFNNANFKPVDENGNVMDAKPDTAAPGANEKPQEGGSTAAQG